MTSKKLLLAGLIAALGMAGSVQAAVVSIKPKLAGIFNADFSPVDPASIVSSDPYGATVLNPNGAKYIAQIDVLMTIGDLQAGQVGFGNAAFNVSLTGLAGNQDIPGWVGDPTQVDSNGTLPQGLVAKWADNLDAGQSGTDLQGIIIGTAPRNFSTATGNNSDPRRSLGIAPYNNGDFSYNDDGEYAGSIYVDIDGVAGAQGVLDLLATGGSIYDPDANLSTAGTTAGGGSLSFQVVPEPSSLALLGLGGVLLALARKRR